MAQFSVPHFVNDKGVADIRIGVKEFQCMGASPPYDHPHVFLDMGHENEIVCPYCSTLFQYDPSLKANASDPAGCVYEITAPAGAPAA
jgi:uncharacterized Zn-finger protein